MAPSLAVLPRNGLDLFRPASCEQSPETLKDGSLEVTLCGDSVTWVVCAVRIDLRLSMTDISPGQSLDTRQDTMI